MAQTMENAGIALESLAASIKRGHADLRFMDAPTYERFATLSDETFDGLSRRTSLPLNLLMLIREATGGATPGPNDRVREDELAVVPYIEIGLAMGFGPFRSSANSGCWPTVCAAPQQRSRMPGGPT